MSERLSTGCRGLDEQLEGGIEIGASTLAYGEPGSGKTSLAIQLSKKVISSGKKSIFIDTEGVSFERIKQIFGDTDTSNLIILEPKDQVELHKSISDPRLIQPDVCIIIVDRIKTEPKKVAGLIMTDDTDVDNRYLKAKIISCGNLVEGLQDNDTIYYDKHAGHDISWKDTLYRVIRDGDVVLVC